MQSGGKGMEQEMSEKQFDKNETEKQEGTGGQQENPMVRKRLFGRGIYGSKDVPIRLLDKLIIGAIVLTVVLIIYSTVNGGFHIRFDTDGGTEIAEQKLRYGEPVAEPAAPTKLGYDFAGWRIKDTETGWNFQLDTVSGSMTLVAQWTPAQITVKFDPAGGHFEETAEKDSEEALANGSASDGSSSAGSGVSGNGSISDGAGSSASGGTENKEQKTVTFGGTYGALPTPVREGYEFAGWSYSGNIITPDSVVQTNGEHVLTAEWR